MIHLIYLMMYIFFTGFRLNNSEKHKMNLNGANNEFFGHDK